MLYVYEQCTYVCVCVQDALRVVLRVLRGIDNAYGAAQLRDCPHQLSNGAVVCRDNFLVYSTRPGKRKLYVMCVFLHAQRVVLTRPRRDKKLKGKTFFEVYAVVEVRVQLFVRTSV